MVHRTYSEIAEEYDEIAHEYRDSKCCLFAITRRASAFSA
jgi:hypothetical protein